jgi:hypothetical protein
MENDQTHQQEQPEQQEQVSVSQKRAAYYQQHRDKIRENQRGYYNRNRERILEKQRKEREQMRAIREAFLAQQQAQATQ